MVTMNAHEAKKKLDDIYQKMMDRVYAHDGVNFNTSHCVQIMCHDEGSMMFYESAFAVKYDGYIFVIAEHHDGVFYHEDDVTVREYTRIWGEVRSHLPWETP